LENLTYKENNNKELNLIWIPNFEIDQPLFIQNTENKILIIKNNLNLKLICLDN
jgi:hypothetical protein